jgi:hypothetical protein
VSDDIRPWFRDPISDEAGPTTEPGVPTMYLTQGLHRAGQRRPDETWGERELRKPYREGRDRAVH